MDIVMLIVFVLVGIVALALIAALFVRRKYSIKREIVIGKPVDEVFEFVRHLKNQDRFSKWVMMDPRMKKDFRGVDGTVGFVYAWNGDKSAGEGEQKIIGLKEGELVDIEIRFVRPFKSTARVPIVTQRISDHQTKVIWGMEGESKYPLNLMTAMMAGVLAKDLETSLDNLKYILEASEQVNA